jgi:glycosyltransferase involved in cell wall biosynthesis
MIFSVCTPVYNRARLLPRVYESLKQQTCNDFEWLIIDDGSTDDTAEIVQPWLREANAFSIRYIRKENGGKHTVLNRAVREARGRFFVVVDSDDWLVPEALETLNKEWNGVSNPEAFTGVCGLFCYDNGRTVGTRFPQDRLVSNAIDLRLRLGVKGDKIGFTRTEIMRRFPFPEEFGQAYVPESIVWNRISQEFDTLFINEVIGMKEYQPGGITSKSGLNSYRNPGAYRIRAAELLNGRRSIGLRSAAQCAATLAKCSLYVQASPFLARHQSHRFLTLAAMPLALGLVIRDRVRLRRSLRSKAKPAPGQTYRSCDVH